MTSTSGSLNLTLSLWGGSALWPLLASGGIATVLLAWWAERWLTPRPQSVLTRKVAANATHVFVLLCVFGLALLLTSRVGLALGLSLAGLALLILVDRDKYRTLREPFLACDFVYFWDVIRHPKLYLPYFGYKKAALLFLGLMVAVTLWWWLEPALILDNSGSVRRVGLATFLLTGGLGILTANYLSQQLSLEPAQDRHQFGLTATLAAYRVASTKKNHQAESALKKGPFAPVALRVTGPVSTDDTRRDKVAQAPIILCIQVESFADFRRIDAYREASQEPHVVLDDKAFELPAWDRLCHQSWATGLLTVPAFGANTVRTEFEFLTGVPTRVMGIHGFEPYQWVSKQSPSLFSAALPAALSVYGYDTSFVHPYDSAFYQRNKVLPKLGFDEFVDLTSFKSASASNDFGGLFTSQATIENNYIGDVALGRFLSNKMRPLKSDRPAFIHAVTMQGHGPYVKGGALPSPHTMLTGYLACLKQTDRMLGELQSALKTMQQPVVLCVFGDHVPILPEVYRQWGLPDGKTNYLIWRNWEAGDGQAIDYASHQLGHQVLKAAGLVAVQRGTPHD